MMESSSYMQLTDDNRRTAAACAVPNPLVGIDDCSMQPICTWNIRKDSFLERAPFDSGHMIH
jgi:hypothetical protein